ncbi:SH3 domain-containing protein [Leptolyngbya ohadii]|uniref:SH3 domain-containing protein n=1 Tax=Leptolyngbya ohadii TaxID=1962290 RepID=UPI00117A06C8|nr:SH3 domain-containing protein [Leptolyngbya ohadii]
MKQVSSFRALNISSVLTGLVVATTVSCTSVPQTSTPSQTEVTQSSDHNSQASSLPQPDVQSSKTVQQTQEEHLANNSDDFQSFLPPENQKLRDFILSDSFLKGFLQNVWIGSGLTDEQLLQRGFYVNTLYKHQGNGLEPKGEVKGACSFIGFRGGIICGRGMMAPHQWGIQSDEAIRRLNVLEEEWGDLQDQSAEMPSSSQFSEPSSSQDRIVQAEDGYANLRIQPSTEVETIAKISNGTSVKILAKQTNSSEQLWYQVQVNGQTGWIYSELLK